MASLVITGGPLTGRRLSVQSETVLGRVDADVTIDDPQISRRHAIVRRDVHGLEIEDLGSLNGTWINGERITSARRLVPGDVISLGETTVAVEDDPRGEAPTAPATGRASSDPLPMTSGPQAVGAPARRRAAHRHGVVRRRRRIDRPR